MKNTLIITTDNDALVSSIDDGTNTLFINDTEIPSSDWVGTGNYTTTVEGHSITIAKIPDLAGNIMIQKVSDYNYKLVSKTNLIPVYQDDQGNVNITGDLTVNGLINAVDIAALKGVVDNVNEKIITGNITPEYKAGESVDIHGNYAGHVTNSSKRLDFFIPLPKSAANSQLTITLSLNSSNGLSVRTISGYLNNTQYIDTSTTDYSISLVGQENGVSVRLSKSTAFTNITNNTVVSVTINGSLNFR